jgi:hypothetical protein
MITRAMRAAVSIVTLITTVALGACARASSPGLAAAAEQRPSIRFDNAADTYVDVYLIGERREWWLGRVAPGVLATLRFPDAALTEPLTYARLAVLAGTPLTAHAARDPRATFTIAEPATKLLVQRWTFVQTQLSSAEIRGAPASGGRQ